MIKKLVAILAIIIFLSIFYSLSRQIYESLGVESRLDIETKKLVNLQKKNIELKKKLEEVQTIGFLEEQARDKLNLIRPGETMVIIPQAEIDKILGEKKVELPPLPNWQGWLKLFWK